MRSNAWVLPETDLPAWHAAFLKGTNVTDIYSPGESSADAAAREAFRRRYGLSPGPSPAASHPPAPIVPARTNIPTRAEAAASVLAGLAECAPVLEELRAASRRPQSRFNLAYDVDNPAVIVMAHYALLKHLGLILKLRASAELALGHTQQAAEDISLIFCLADAIRHEPFLMAYQARVAQVEVGLQPLAEGLARHQWSDPQLRAFEERLRGFDLCADGWRALEGERVFFGAGLIDYVLQSPDRYRVLADGGDGGDAEHSFNWEAAVLAALPSGWLYLEKLSCCRLFDPYLDSGIDVRAHRVSPDECLKGGIQFCGVGNNPEPVLVLRHQFFCPQLVPSLSEPACKVAFAQTGLDAAALACALERCRLARGAFPESLDALAPEFTTALPHDIITGQPLKYRRTPDGQYLLYSVGWNQTDDGGVLGLRSNSTRIDQAEGDWVWRLPP